MLGIWSSSCSFWIHSTVPREYYPLSGSCGVSPLYLQGHIYGVVLYVRGFINLRSYSGSVDFSVINYDNPAALAGV